MTFNGSKIHRIGPPEIGRPYNNVHNYCTEMNRYKKGRRNELPAGEMARR